ncbi:MAG: ATP-binding protein [candidate division Zixibacteria bacterium]|nr:ATP-binding protein [candidate division Zixibacteria bacterium]
MTPRIVITGAPASGKTEFVERLKAEPPFGGFVFFDELARRLLRDHPRYRHEPMAFHTEIYRRQTEREAETGERPFVTDRGTLDAFAFHPEAMAAVGTSREREYARYTAVIQLGSAAVLGERYYRRDEIRRESPDEALAIERAIRDVWGDHPTYRFLPACENYTEKYAAFLAVASALIVENGLDNRLSLTSLS